jgi:hypothetical protein
MHDGCDGCSGHMLNVWSDFVGRSDDGIHGIAVGVVEEITFVTTLGNVSSGHVRSFDRFFSLCS